MIREVTLTVTFKIFHFQLADIITAKSEIKYGKDIFFLLLLLQKHNRYHYAGEQQTQ